MNKLDELLRLTTEEIPWALSRFNDGEMRAMCHPGHGSVARGDQPCTHDLSLSLKWAIGQRRKNLFIGVPCSICWPGHSARADAVTKDLGEFKTKAVVQTNRNLVKFKEEMASILNRQEGDRKVIWVSGDDQDVSKLPFTISEHVKLPTKDAYTVARDKLKAIGWWGMGDVVFLSCGPLATIAAVYLFLKFDKTTFIDIGSTWDPETRNVKHRCHTFQLKPCAECN